MGPIIHRLGQLSILTLQDYLVELNGLPARVVDSDFAALTPGVRAKLARNRQKRVHYRRCTSEVICAICGTTKKLERHHIIPPRLGGRNVRENIVWLCHTHHVQCHGGK